jgi:hypothetical protein
MFVRPDAEGSGVGKLLLREAIVAAEALRDLRQVYLTVLATNERAQRLYASLGFRGYAREPGAVRIGDMVKVGMGEQNQIDFAQGLKFLEFGRCFGVAYQPGINDDDFATRTGDFHGRLAQPLNRHGAGIGRDHATCKA